MPSTKRFTAKQQTTSDYDPEVIAGQCIEACAYTYADGGTLAKMHHQLHLACTGMREFTEQVIAGEQVISRVMRSRGIEHRENDALAKAAGTLIGKLRPPTLWEVQAYLSSVGLDTMPIMLVQDTETKDLFLDVRSPLLKSASESILRALNRMLPAALQLQLLGKGEGDGFMSVSYPYSISLNRNPYDEAPQVTTKMSLMRGLRNAAASASSVFKSTLDLPFNLIKFPIIKAAAAGDEERIVTAVILEPEVPDATKTEESEADIYSEEDIRKGMYWWMENAGHAFVYYHIKDGGWVLGEADVVLLENWQQREDTKIGEQEVRKGSWVATARIRSDKLWQDIKDGKITGWSVGMYAMGQIEELETEEAA